MKLLQEHPNPSEDDLGIFANKIKEVESLGLACEYRNATTGRGGIRSVVEITKKEETDKPPWIHHLCGKNHKKGACAIVCTGCGMKGSHKPPGCWKLHPELKPKYMESREERDRVRLDTERGLEAEKKEGKEARGEGKKPLYKKSGQKSNIGR